MVCLFGYYMILFVLSTPTVSMMVEKEFVGMAMNILAQKMTLLMVFFSSIAIVVPDFGHTRINQVFDGDGRTKRQQVNDLLKEKKRRNNHN